MPKCPELWPHAGTWNRSDVFDTLNLHSSYLFLQLKSCQLWCWQFTFFLEKRRIAVYNMHVFLHLFISTKNFVVFLLGFVLRSDPEWLWKRDPDPRKIRGTPPNYRHQDQSNRVQFLHLHKTQWKKPCCGSSIFCQCGSGPGSGSRSRVLMTKNGNEFAAEKKFWSKTAIYLSLGLHP